jgi:hypothetical protein
MGVSDPARRAQQFAISIRFRPHLQPVLVYSRPFAALRRPGSTVKVNHHPGPSDAQVPARHLPSGWATCLGRCSTRYRGQCGRKRDSSRLPMPRISPHGWLEASSAAFSPKRKAASQMHSRHRPTTEISPRLFLERGSDFPEPCCGPEASWNLGLPPERSA